MKETLSYIQLGSIGFYRNGRYPSYIFPPQNLISSVSLKYPPTTFIPKMTQALKDITFLEASCVELMIKNITIKIAIHQFHLRTFQSIICGENLARNSHLFRNTNIYSNLRIKVPVVNDDGAKGIHKKALRLAPISPIYMGRKRIMPRGDIHVNYSEYFIFNSVSADSPTRREKVRGNIKFELRITWPKHACLE